MAGLGRGEIEDRLATLADAIDKGRPLWEPRPFLTQRVPWEDGHRDLSQAVRALDESALDRLETSDVERSRWFEPYLDQAPLLAAMADIPRLPAVERPVGSHDSVSIPGRKWDQIQQMAACLPDPGLPVLEWCSGKGHLGRFLGKLHQQPVACVERDQRLTHQGALMAGERGAAVDFHTLDALSPDAGEVVVRDQHAVALHACGELHLRLMDHCLRRQTRYLSLSPCCYHLIEDQRYAPRSSLGRDQDLRLDRDQLRIPLQETVTAPAGVTRRRVQASRWRLGFDLLQRELRGEDRYLSVPSIPTGLLKESFAAFCRWAAEKRSLDLPANPRFDDYELAGAHRWEEVRRTGLVRRLFQRPLEVWLVLDRALSLAEAGYQVRLGTFCDRSSTPRNLLILARRS